MPLPQLKQWPLLSFRLNETCPGESRELESKNENEFWTPAFAGVTALVTLYVMVNIDWLELKRRFL